MSSRTLQYWCHIIMPMPLTYYKPHISQVTYHLIFYIYVFCNVFHCDNITCITIITLAKLLYATAIMDLVWSSPNARKIRDQSLDPREREISSVITCANVCLHWETGSAMDSGSEIFRGSAEFRGFSRFFGHSRDQCKSEEKPRSLGLGGGVSQELLDLQEWFTYKIFQNFVSKRFRIFSKLYLCAI